MLKSLKHMNDKKPLLVKILVCIFPFAALSLVYFLRYKLIYLGTTFPQCPSVTFFDIYCLGCGNTRSVQHLLIGDIAGSLRFNPVPLLGIIIAFLAYIELITYIFGKHKKILPRNRIVWVLFIIIMSIYFIVRNFIRPF